jgi:hypothetical protein
MNLVEALKIALADSALQRELIQRGAVVAITGDGVATDGAADEPRHGEFPVGGIDFGVPLAAVTVAQIIALANDGDWSAAAERLLAAFGDAYGAHLLFAHVDAITFRPR